MEGVSDKQKAIGLPTPTHDSQSTTLQLLYSFRISDTIKAYATTSNTTSAARDTCATIV